LVLFKILNWNIGGAKSLEIKERSERKEFKEKLNEFLRHVIHDLQRML